MRHLSPTFLESTLRRGKPIEQFLGGYERDGERLISWLEIRPKAHSFEVLRLTVPDAGDAEHLDIYALMDDESEEAIVVLQSAEAALSYAHTALGASDIRWVNETVSQEEYKDFMAAGRPLQWSPLGV